MSDADRQRLDKWLWMARFAKTRGRAQELCAGGHVKLNGQSVDKPATAIRPGDTLTLTLGPWRRHLRVEALPHRRGPASEARTLYGETAPAERLVGPPSLNADSPGGRPNKKERRQLARLKDPLADQGE
ncbi:RNA-binding S4 domain-containing protein [Roseospirillum parvum]|uniref:Ribosome-associated heat shock protein Hsp15 n=1 Tax=Roseospirillum parvum TaxID=83401 RepID=A0A1G8DPQ0_9PROT|nr:RNA-binding S4 domain-containing protein [Roseospirillum parvum]SDH59370.1 ribosome-associated heat shock protein Hsp15 [Roseospirillum parvum]